MSKTVETEKTSKVEKVRAKIGTGFLYNAFGRKRFMHCLKELIKNARDWGAKHINIYTVNKQLLRLVDDGEGMTQKNRGAFSSVNLSTASGERQSGQFGSG